MRKYYSFFISSILAFFIANSICFFYERPVGYIDKDTGITSGIRRPNSILIHGTEGYGISKIDKNGFINQDKNLKEKDYIIVMGSSHTQGKEVKISQRYTYILNDKIAKKEDELEVYNVACDGNFLIDILKRFNQTVKNFPNSKAIILEFGNFEYSIDELYEGLNSTGDDLYSNATDAFRKLSLSKKIKNNIKESFPLISLYKQKLETYNKENKENKESDINYIDDEYLNVFEENILKIRNEYSESIILLYHPDVEIVDDVNLKINKSLMIESLKKIAEKNNIIFVDMSEEFLKYYNENRKVPYGFNNTTLGKGHLNETGHKLIAEKLYQVLKENEI